MSLPGRFVNRPYLMVICIFFRIICLSVILVLTLSASGIPIEGYAIGFIVQTSDHIAFLNVNASGMKSPRLLALDFKKRSLLWDVNARGDTPWAFRIVDDRLITIEDDWMVSRAISTGKVVWKRDLWKSIPLDNYGNRKNDRYVYQLFRPAPDCGIVFRQLLFGGQGDVLSYGPVDWIRFDLRTGRVVQWGEQKPIGFSERFALLHEFNKFFLLDQNGLQFFPVDDEHVSDMFEDAVSGYSGLVSRSVSDGILFEAGGDETETIYKTLFPGDKRFRTVRIRKIEDVEQKAILVGNFLLVFAEPELRASDDNTGREKKDVCWLKSFDMNGNETGHIENKLKIMPDRIVNNVNGRSVFFGSENNQGYHLFQFLLPELKIAGHYLHPIRPGRLDGFALAEAHGVPVLCIIGNANCTFEKMSEKKRTHSIHVEFIDFNSGKELWTYQHDITVKRIR